MCQGLSAFEGAAVVAFDAVHFREESEGVEEFVEVAAGESEFEVDFFHGVVGVVDGEGIGDAAELAEEVLEAEAGFAVGGVEDDGDGDLSHAAEVADFPAFDPDEDDADEGGGTDGGEGEA